MAYPLKRIVSATAVKAGYRLPLLVNQPYCTDASGTCCDAFVGCYSNPPDEPATDDPATYTIDFSVYGGSETCSWDTETDWLDCGLSGWQRPNTGDGFKGNVVQNYTWSITREEAVVQCGPASFTSQTKGAFEYTERRPGQLPAYAVYPTPILQPNQGVTGRFAPAYSAASQVASLFLFVYPSIGPAADCSSAPPTTVP
jgi:hypothetical protein